MKNKIILTAIFLIGALFVTQNVFGPPFDPPDGGGTPVGVPIDGGISALIAAGVALISRKFFKDSKKKKQE